MFAKIRLYFFTVCLGFFAFIGHAQQFQFQNLSVQDGLSQSQVYTIVEDHAGYIWMGTRGGGLSRFDGQRFVTFTTSNGLPSNYVNALYVDNDNVLWIGTDDGVAKLTETGITSIESEIEVGSVSSLCEQNERIVLGTNKGVFSISNVENQLIADSRFEGESIHVLTIVDSNLWIGTDNGIFIIDEDSVNVLTEDSGLNSALIRSIYVDDQDGVWIGTYGGGLNFWRDGLDNVSEWFPLKDTKIHAIISDDESLWFATQSKGLCRFNRKDSTAQFITSSHGLANNHVRALFTDSWSNLWIGTSGGGVSKFSGQEFDYYAKENGLSGNYIYSIAEDCLGTIWIGTTGRSLSLATDSGMVEYNLPNGVSAAKSRCVLQSGDSTIWLGSEASGLYVIGADTTFHFQSTTGLGGNMVQDILEDPYGAIWVALSDGGITKWSKDHKTNSWIPKRYGSSDLGSSRILSLHIDKLNRLWYAGIGCGIGSIIDDTIWNGWKNDSNNIFRDVNALEEDAMGNLWVGTTRSGLQRMNLYDGAWNAISINTESGLASSICYQLAWDGNRHLWVGSEKGIQRLTLDENGQPIEFELVDYDAGFLGVETTLNASLLDSKGRLWFGSINGLSRLVGDIKTGVVHLPKLSIERFRINAKQVSLAKTAFKMPYDSNSIAIEFKAISQINAGSIEYQWRLLGLEQEWSSPSQNARVNYSNLEGGNYAFQVRATLDRVHWTEIESIELTIDAPYWEKPWFVIISIAGLIFMIVLTVALRVRTIRRSAAQKEGELRIEKEMVELEQKALRLQMNPHFIFNALNSIQAMISGNDPKTARYFLAKFSKLMRQVLENSRHIQIPLEREIETLNNYLSIEQFCHGNRFEFSVNIQGQLDVEDVQIPPMLIQPFVENAVIHGVSQLKSNGLIGVSFQQEGDYLVCEIRDNGIGRKAAEGMKSQEGQKHKSTALIITQERLDKLNDIEDGIRFIDLYDEAKEPAGTLVVLKVRILD
ncbi:MAG: histidine kinase [Flavobacteriales bacterium]|nr:histidine kinase [Flavobacteriales bacterium]